MNRVAGGPSGPASLPPVGLPGLDPGWSRLVEAPDAEGVARTWHVLDSHAGAAGDGAGGEPLLTLLCVHGNPTWSYLWRSVVSSCDASCRVIAVDQLGMGWSERTGRVHRLADRITELGHLTDVLGLTGPVVTVGHDWGGAISLGWALDHREQLVGLVLTNTAVAHPEDERFPPLLGAVRLPGVLRTSTVTTSAFVDGTLRLAHPALAPEVRAAFRSPYATAARRAAVGDFVEDIPLRPDHPSHARLVELQQRLPELADVPALLLWGSRDPVFGDVHLRDLQRRLPHAVLHRYPAAGHLVVEDAPVADAVAAFASDVLASLSGAAPETPSERPSGASVAAPAQARDRRPLWSELVRRDRDPRPAIVELHEDRTRSVSWQLLSTRVDQIAAGLVRIGVAAGDRVGLLVPPGADLTAVLYACWRMGAVVVVADAGLGLTGLRRALRGARLDVVVGARRGLAAARAMGLSARVIGVGDLSTAERRALRVEHTLLDVARLGRDGVLPPAPGREAEAAVLFTSGATGPAKGVVYRHRQLEAQRDAVATMLSVHPEDRLVAAFAPFALYGPALGIASAVPDMDVTAPGSLRAGALADAVQAVDATLVFASPAALRSVLATSDELSDAQRESLTSVRTLLSAGAPVPRDVLRAAAQLLGDAIAHTPYGMTEALPVADVTLAELDALGDGRGYGRGAGVCVGRPLVGVDVAVSPLDDLGRAVGGLTTKADVTGEVVVRAEHVKDRYDQLWLTQRASARPAGWHRTGDVGHLDADGQLWVEGRLGHVVVTAGGVVTPVGVEQALEDVDGVRLAAAVGVGPRGAQQLVAVVESDEPVASPRQATLTELDRMRAALADVTPAETVVIDLTDTSVPREPVELAAAFVVPSLPVDVRHNSKSDRSRMAAWADSVLAGDGLSTP